MNTLLTTVFPVLFAIGVLAWCIRERRKSRRITKHIQRELAEFSAFVQPMLDYLDFIKEHNQKYTEDGYKAFLAGRGMNYDAWLRLGEAMKQRGYHV